MENEFKFLIFIVQYEVDDTEERPGSDSLRMVRQVSFESKCNSRYLAVVLVLGNSTVPIFRGRGSFRSRENITTGYPFVGTCAHRVESGT